MPFVLASDALPNPYKLTLNATARQRAAIARLGAKQDGVLRNHQRMPDGSFRDTVVFSIIESEWLTVKRHLQYKLEQPRA